MDFSPELTARTLQVTALTKPPGWLCVVGISWPCVPSGPYLQPVLKDSRGEPWANSHSLGKALEGFESHTQAEILQGQLRTQMPP